MTATETVTTETLGLRARAWATLEAVRAARAKAAAARVEEKKSQTAAVLDTCLARLGISGATFTFDPDGNAEAMVDGLRFIARDFEDIGPGVALVMCCPDCGDDHDVLFVDEWSSPVPTPERLLCQIGQILREPPRCEACARRARPTPRTPIEKARDAIAAVKRAGDALKVAVVSEQAYLDRAGLEKSGAVQRIMGTENPETKKPHSASSAEKIVESDADYATFLLDKRIAVQTRIEAWTHYDAAKKEADLAVALAAAEALRDAREAGY